MEEDFGGPCERISLKKIERRAGKCYINGNVNYHYQEIYAYRINTPLTSLLY